MFHTNPLIPTIHPCAWISVASFSLPYTPLLTDMCNQPAFSFDGRIRYCNWHQFHGYTNITVKITILVLTLVSITTSPSTS